MERTATRYIDMLTNDLHDVLLAELVTKILQGEELDANERVVLRLAHNKVNPDFKIN